MTTYLVHKDETVWGVYALDGNPDRGMQCLSLHTLKAEAEAARKRYEEADKRRRA